VCYVCVCARACMRACMRACVRACVREQAVAAVLARPDKGAGALGSYLAGALNHVDAVLCCSFIYIHLYIYNI
jgi:hypothetical protein